MSIDADTDRAVLAGLLDWYVESGVDLALDDAPHDRYAESVAGTVAPRPLEMASLPAAREPEPRREPQITQSVARRDIAPIAPDMAARAAQEDAAAARDLDELARRLEAFEHAPFRGMAQHFLFAAGACEARVMAFDVAPGASEELSGEAFSGLRAALLDNMLAAISLDRALMETDEPATRLRGKRFDIRCGDHVARAFVLAPLESILTSPALKPAAWRELRAVAEMLR